MSTILDTKDYIRNNSNIVISESGRAELKEEWDYEVKDNEEVEEADEKKIELIQVAPSKFVEFAIKIPDKITQKRVPFSFNGRSYLRLPYDTAAKRTLLKMSRQTEKSTMLGNKCLTYACLINSFSVLYVSPTNAQTKIFSQDRLKEPIETSEHLQAWSNTKLQDNVFLKKFVNRSQITLRYAFHNADRIRGIASDMVLIDEIQDIMTDNIDVIEESASHSPYKIFIYSGTPKSNDNAIEFYWTNFSTQNEWIIPCRHHGTPKDPSSWRWNILREDNIGPVGLVCDKCRNPIDPTDPDAQWASMNPEVKTKLSDYYEGFHIPQLMVPWLEWPEILDKQTKMSRATFYNEVLGLSFDSGNRPLTTQDIVDNCDPRLSMTDSSLAELHNRLGQSSPIFAGIDWGSSEGSYTVLCLGTYINEKFTIFYLHRFEGPETEPPVQLEIIENLIVNWGVRLIGTDYGGGYDRNYNLIRKFGPEKIFKYQYSAPSQKIKWDQNLHRFLVHRTEVMSDIFNAIKRRDVFSFPNWEQFKDPFGNDFLNIFSEYNEQQRQIQYKKSPDTTDDSFHAVLLCMLVSIIHHPRVDILVPTSKSGSTNEYEY